MNRLNQLNKILLFIIFLVIIAGFLLLYYVYSPDLSFSSLTIVQTYIERAFQNTVLKVSILIWLILLLYSKFVAKPNTDKSISEPSENQIKTASAQSQGIQNARRPSSPTIAQFGDPMEEGLSFLDYQNNLGQLVKENMDMINFVDQLCNAGINLKISDIHIHPLYDKVRIHFRVNGQLKEVLSLPIEFQAPLLMRLKVLFKLVSYQTNKPQDGKTIIRNNDQDTTMRISLIPTNYGEKVVIRLALKSGQLPALETLGFVPQQIDVLKKILMQKQGLIFLTGPTGSGKSTTIYSSLNYINSVRKNRVQMVTIEDPIERDVPFLAQSEVNRKTGFTFADGLRSILRQDPDVIMVGEIRDAETARIAIQAGLSGHLLLTTIHADSAAGAFNRMIDMGVEPFLIASATLASISQRLLPAICPHCSSKISEHQQEFTANKTGPSRIYNAQGCSHCDFTGYLGSVAVFEILTVDEQIKNLILEKRPTSEINHMAKQNNMITIRDAATVHAEQGLTTLDEIEGIGYE